MLTSKEAFEMMRDCRLCPRNCGVDRLSGKLGFCATGAEFAASAVCAHHGEEPVISGDKGSCTIFFTHCNMQCVFCQNYQISRNVPPQYAEAKYKTLESICRSTVMLLGEGCHNVNFVSPSHVIPQMLAIIEELRHYGLKPTVVYNTNGYDKVETLRLIEPYIDVYLPDLKYSNPHLAKEYSQAHNYPQVAQEAILEMVRQKGLEIELDENGAAKKGVIVRHLVLPGQVENSLDCLRFLAREVSPDIHLSLMSQYHPTKHTAHLPKLQRTLVQKDYQRVLDELGILGMENGWVQQLSSSGYYNPDFDSEHPFEDAN